MRTYTHTHIHIYTHTYRLCTSGTDTCYSRPPTSNVGRCAPLETSSMASYWTRKFGEQICKNVHEPSQSCESFRDFLIVFLQKRLYMKISHLPSVESRVAYCDSSLPYHCLQFRNIMGSEHISSMKPRICRARNLCSNAFFFARFLNDLDIFPFFSCIC